MSHNVMSQIAGWVAPHLPLLLAAVTLLLASGGLCLALVRSPAHRQRIGELTLAAVLVGSYWRQFHCRDGCPRAVLMMAAVRARGKVTPRRRILHGRTGRARLRQPNQSLRLRLPITCSTRFRRIRQRRILRPATRLQLNRSRRDPFQSIMQPPRSRRTIDVRALSQRTRRLPRHRQ